MKTIALTAVALTAFAANSVLCRLALDGTTIDGASFTAIRLLSGAAVLMLIVMLRGGYTTASSQGGWISSMMLFLYAAAFSFAYTTLNTATGALILFGAVQITMIARSVMVGDRLKAGEWMGVAIATSGLIYLMLPSATTPSLTGFALMTLAGIAWGVYSLRGRGSTSPLMDSADNFARTLPLAALLALISLPHAHYSTAGVGLAMLSGGVASGIGYAIWYAAMGGMSATQAAAVQLLVPLIAAGGGAIWLAEAASLRLITAATMILGGILMVVMARRV